MDAATVVLAAGGADGGLPDLVLDIALSLVVAGVLAIGFTRLRIPTVAAFLLAGVLLGPVVTGLISDRDNIDTIAQLGLILLLFLIGLEIDVRHFRGPRARLTGLALGLSALLALIIGIALHAAGIAVGLIHRWETGRKLLRFAGALVMISGFYFLWNALS